MNKLLSKQSFEGPVIDLSTADVVAQALPTFDTEKTNISDRDSKSPILTIDECCIETAGDEFAQRDGAVNTTFKNTTNKTSLKTVFLISGTTHFIFLAALIHFTDFGTVLKQTAMEPEIIPIQATLYFPPQVIQAPEALEKPPEIEAQAPLQEPIQEISEAIAEQEIIPEITEEIATIEPATSEVQEIDATVSEVTDTELAVDETLPEMPTEEGSATLQSDTNRSTRMEQLNRAMSSHLNNMQQAQIQEMSLDALRNRELDFYQRQTQGLKPTPEVQQDNPLDYAEEMLETGNDFSASHQSNFKPKNVNCDSTAGKVATGLSFFTGGRVKCTEKPDFQKYIDARLKKLPEK